MSIANEILRLQTAKADIKTAIENKGVMVGDGTIDTYAEKINEISGGEGDYEQGYNDGYEKGSMPLYYSDSFSLQNAEFPENTELCLRYKNKRDYYSAFYNTTNLKSIKLICETSSPTYDGTNIFRNSPQLEIVDLTELQSNPKNIRWGFLGDKKLKSILGAFDFSGCTACTEWLNSCDVLEDISFVPNTIKISINFIYSSKLTNASKQSIFDGLATVETAQTLTLHANVKILQSQVDSANAKGWTVAGGTVVSEEEYYG
ncbi:MAG: hypothetical protein U0L88_11945 [Acutalibacteraceae bacterium]|nr:hypothetical protein [Acutalibacteraceae bacterium]